MIELEFQGWFQCRLATDPDPYDEPRGVSGYVRAYADEPDLDRVIRFQNPPFERSHCPEVGVRVTSVTINGRSDPQHPLVKASVDLIGDPVFEGRNGVVAEDAFEPIWPFVLSVVSKDFRLERAIVAHNPDYPFPEFFATPGGATPEEIRQVTGVPNLAAVWRDRATRLVEQLNGGVDEPHRTAISERLNFLRSGRGLGFFNASMTFGYALRSNAVIEDPSNLLVAKPDVIAPWNVNFWLGAWDADALCGFANGTLSIPTDTTIEMFTSRSVRRANVGSLRS